MRLAHPPAVSAGLGRLPNIASAMSKLHEQSVKGPHRLPSRASPGAVFPERDMSLRPFHIAFPVDDLEAARRFYGGVMQCPEGRSADSWIDFDLFGHQIVAHLDSSRKAGEKIHNPVDGHDVPVPHFGVVLEMKDWEALAERLRAGGIRFVIEPTIRFKGQVGEQATMFFLDPAGNALEFKAFADLSQLFAK
jgi:extradiol dioxygenase family protein